MPHKKSNLLSRTVGKIIHEQIKKQDEIQQKAGPGVTPTTIDILSGRAKQNSYDRKLPSRKLDKIILRLMNRGKWSYDNEVVYRFKCLCQRTVLLTAQDVFVREKLGLGCLHPECNVSAKHYLAWHNKKFAWWLQFGQLVLHHHRHLDESWGGDVEGLAKPIVPIHEFWPSFLSDMERLAEDQSDKTYWLTWTNTNLPVGYYSVELRSVPDLYFLRLPDLAFYTGTQFLSYQKTYGLGVSAEEQLKLVYETYVNFVSEGQNNG